MEAISPHRDLYKKNRTPWKETFRKRCSDRMKENRNKILDHFRTSQQQTSVTVDNIIHEEWNKLLQQSNTDCNNTTRLPLISWNDSKGVFEGVVKSNIGGSVLTEGRNDEINEALKVLEEIQEELLREEQQILSEYSQKLHFDEEMLNATLQQHLDTTTVFCPICRTKPLTRTPTGITCICGVYFNTRVTLGEFNQRLTNCVNEHAGVCESVPDFFVYDGCMMICNKCSYMANIV